VIPQNLSLNLSLSARVAQALSQAGQALLAAASALNGEVAPSTPASLSLTPAPGATDNLSVAELIAQFLRAKARQDRSDRYLRALRNSLCSFSRGRRNVPAREVTIAQVEEWLGRQGWAPRTQKGYLGDVRTLYNWGMKRNLVDRNPGNAVEIRQQLEGEPGILTPEQVRTILTFAQSFDADICRALAIQFFAGLRTSEVERLEEEEIRLDQGTIEIKAEKAKTRRRRPVAIQPNLRAWLGVGGRLPLRTCSNRWRWFRAALKKKHGIEWVRNGPRHSFVSYHLQQFGSAAKTALEAGHTEQMTFAHYRALVTPASAAEYWEIVPSDPKGKRP
jgi:integrase